MIRSFDRIQNVKPGLSRWRTDHDAAVSRSKFRNQFSRVIL